MGKDYLLMDVFDWPSPVLWLDCLTAQALASIRARARTPAMYDRSIGVVPIRPERMPSMGRARLSGGDFVITTLLDVDT